MSVKADVLEAMEAEFLYGSVLGGGEALALLVLMLDYSLGSRLIHSWHLLVDLVSSRLLM